MPLLKIFLMWLLFLPVPVFNGFIRDKWYKHVLGELPAHIVGTIGVSLVFLFYVFLFFKKTILENTLSELFMMGAIWLILTIIFEFGIGLAAGRSWEYMLSDYNIIKGRIWPLLLSIVFFSPVTIRELLKR